jgi:hypothetical protein
MLKMKVMNLSHMHCHATRDEINKDILHDIACRII